MPVKTTTKKVVKKALKKTIVKKVVVKEKFLTDKDFKTGDFFSAEIKGQRAVGQIYVQGSSVYYCQDVMEGSRCDNRLGFKYSWINDPLVKNRKKLTLKEFQARYKGKGGVLDTSKLPKQLKYKVAGQPVILHDNLFIFGCGAVKISKEELILLKNTLSPSFKKLLAHINNYHTLKEDDISAINKLLKEIK